MNRRRGAAVLLLLLLAGCGGTKEVPAPPSEAGTEPRAHGPTMSASDLELYFHRPNPTDGGMQKPIGLLRAGKFDIDPGGKSYAIEAVHIEITEDANQEAIVLDGVRGRYQEGHEARLEGGVTVQMGTTRIEVEDITYELPNAEGGGEIYSDSPVRLESPERSLRASSLRLDPETKRMILKNAAGTLTLGGSKP